MNQLCRVCGEPAAGFHFGAFTCEGCKSFFGRTYNNLSSVSECKNNGECIINKKNRTSCKACRLRKCLLVGMSKSGSRYGRRSNWFKIHCLLQEQQLQHQHQHQQTLQTQLGGGLQTKTASWDYAAKNAAILLDIDNNNTPSSETKSESPPSAASHTFAKAPDSSSFWSSSPSPLTVPHQHRLPYFISPFLQNPLQPIAHNYLLPFLPIRPPLSLEPLVIPSPPSSLQSSPTSAVTTPMKASTPDEADQSSLDQLRSLGPEQDQPIDLSAAKTKDKETQCRRENRSPAELVSRCEGRECEGEKRQVEKCGEAFAKSTTPLDLRRSKP